MKSEDIKVPWYWGESDGHLFEGINAEAQQIFLRNAKLRAFKKNQKLFDAADAAHQVYFVQSGLVKIYNLSASGAVTIFWFCGPGALFGAGGISGAQQQSVSAQAVQDTSVLILPRQAFETFIEASPRAGLNVIRILSARLRLACDAFAQQTVVQTTARITRLLLQLAHAPKPAGGLDQIRVDITQQDLADMAGAGRQTVNAVLGELRKLGLIHTERGHLMIPSIEALHRYYESFTA